MSGIVIRVENLSKRYRIGSLRPSYKTLRESLTEAAQAPLRRAAKLLRGEAYGAAGLEETIWALKDVSFRVDQGEVVGIIGRNGAGKTTLLKILSRITEPTEGCAEIHGRMGALLEVGTGFHPELTGRENIYLNGAILGMRKVEIESKFDEIVAFSGVEQFIDTPIKHYSSGMAVRLAFSVAAHLEPEILLVDEVLAVGDAAFQRKCMGKMQDVAREGRTVLFVSHNMGAIQSMCQRAIWLNGGKVMSDGVSRQVVQQYMGSASGDSVLYAPQPSRGYTDLIIEKMVLKNSQGQITKTVSSGEELHIEIYYHALKRLPKPYFWIAIRSRFGSLCGANMLFDGACPECIEGRGMIACTFSALRLLPQIYTIRLGIRHQNGINNYIENAEISFAVTGAAQDLGMEGEMAHNFFDDFYCLLVPYAWHLPDGKIVPVNGFHVCQESASPTSDLGMQNGDQ